jgi:hypothetical protein
MRGALNSTNPVSGEQTKLCMMAPLLVGVVGWAGDVGGWGRGDGGNT